MKQTETKPILTLENGYRTEPKINGGQKYLSEYVLRFDKMRYATIEANDAQDKKNADLIVESVNNYQRLKDAALRLCDIAAKTTQDIIGFDGAEELDSAIDNLKSITQ